MKLELDIDVKLDEEQIDMFIKMFQTSERRHRALLGRVRSLEAWKKNIEETMGDMS